MYADYCWRHMSHDCKKRYYCPSCGQVKCARPVFATQYFHIEPHTRFEYGQPINCPGGIIVEKDKAP